VITGKTPEELKAFVGEYDSLAIVPPSASSRFTRVRKASGSQVLHKQVLVRFGAFLRSFLEPYLLTSR
jgi:hypothetical protein